MSYNPGKSCATLYQGVLFRRSGDTLWSPSVRFASNIPEHGPPWRHGTPAVKTGEEVDVPASRAVEGMGLGYVSPCVAPKLLSDCGQEAHQATEGQDLIAFATAHIDFRANAIGEFVKRVDGRDHRRTTRAEQPQDTGRCFARGRGAQIETQVSRRDIARKHFGRYIARYLH